MTRIGRDSTTAADIPLVGLDVAMGYANGRYAWTGADWQRFTKAGIATADIDVNGTYPGSDVLDVEPGNATIATAVSWIIRRKKLTPRPAYPGIIYCSRSTLTPLFNAMNAAGLVIVRDFRLWIATLDGTKTVADMTGVTAIQWKPASSRSGPGHYDESVIYDPAWKAPKPPPTPPPAPRLVKVSATATFSDGSTKAVTWP